jgi:hypothetical protein
LQNCYEFTPYVDSNTENIENAGQLTPEQLASRCDSLPNCAGFNSNGWIKSRVDPPSAWYRWTDDASKGFYKRQDKCMKTTTTTAAATTAPAAQAPAGTFYLSHPDGRMIRWTAGDDSARLNEGKPALIQATSPPGIFGKDKGYVALQTADRSLRHAGWACWWHAFADNNFDFAWLFTRQPDGAFILDNGFNPGFATALGYDAGTDRVTLCDRNDAARLIKWRVTQVAN